MKVRVIKQADQVFTYDQDADAIREMLQDVKPGERPPGELYDITDLDRSDMDADEYLIVTEDDGTPVWSGWLGGVQKPAPASIARDATPTPVQRLLALKLPGHNDAGATDVRDYLRRLLATLWQEEEGFSGKRPFGNSGWQYDIYAPMIAAGMIPGRLDEDGCVERCDTDAADRLICAAIDAMCRGQA